MGTILVDFEIFFSTRATFYHYTHEKQEMMIKTQSYSPLHWVLPEVKIHPQ